MELVVIDGARMTSREAAHAELARALAFPEYYGANLDALWDLVSTMAADAVLVNASAMLASLEDYGTALLDTLRDAADENPAFRFRIEE